MKRGSHPVMSVGFTSILVIFIILCLTAFAMLSVVSAKSDERLTSEVTGQTDQSLSAGNKAEEALARIDDRLRSLYASSSDKSEYYAACGKVFSDEGTEFADDLLWEDDAESAVITYSEPISDTRSLRVKLQVLYPETSGDSFYRVLTWQSVNISDWTPDTTLPVYGGN